ncbi:MAG: aromatic ring-hydroxylating dioxygenase subunit alpha [Pseudomonadota bacterium]
MQRHTRRELVQRIRGYLTDGSTALGERLFENPIGAYADSERLRLEQQTLFRRYPLLVGLSCDLARPGDYLTDDFSGVPLLLVRQSDGRVAGFINACRHRGAPVASGAGEGAEHFVCPYHAWRYGIDGQLLGVPGEAGFAGLDRAQCGLTPIAVAERYGMLWAVPDPALATAALDIDAHLKALAPEYESYGFERYQHFATRVLRPRINWKMGIDGFLESYHLRVLHPRTVGPLYFTNLATADAFGLNHRMVAVRKSFAEETNPQVLEDDFLRYTNILYTLFPNTMFVYQIDHLEVWRLFPDGDAPNRSLMVLSMYVPEPVTSDSAQRHWDRNLELAIATVEGEDLALGERIQRGYDSGVVTPAVYGRNEPALIHFHSSVECALGIERAHTG